MLRSAILFVDKVIRVRAGGKLSHGQGADDEFGWELLGVDVIQIDHDRGVNKAPRRTRSLSPFKRTWKRGGRKEL